MDWKKISIERLRAYEARKTALDIIPEQIEALELQYTTVRAASTDATAVKGGGNKREDALINNIVMREELMQNYTIAERETKITEKGLEGLNAEQRDILQKFYVNRTRNYIDDLCESLCVERSRVYELKDEALKKFTMSCYGVVEI